MTVDAELELFTCAMCGDENDVDDAEAGPNGEALCESCFQYQVGTCERCDDPMYTDDAMGVWSGGGMETWCNSCYDNYAGFCEYCEESHDADDLSRYRVYNEGTIYLCQTCECDTNYYTCVQCDDFVADDYVIFDRNDEPNCPDCHRSDENNGSDARGPGWDHTIRARGGTGDEIRSTRAISAEIESGLTDRAYHHLGNEMGLHIVTDSSVTVSGYMEEEVHVGPLVGEAFESTIRDATDAMREYGYKVNASCGLHIHVNARDLSWLALRNVWLASYLYEPVVLGMMPKSRDNNQHCKNMRGLFNKEEILRIDDDDSFHDVYYRSSTADKTDKYHNARYAAVNMHSWYFRGSIEFRYHSGTGSADKIIQWAEICTSLVEWAKDQKPQDILDAIALNGVTVDGMADTLGLSDRIRGHMKRRTEKFSGQQEVASDPTEEQPDILSMVSDWQVMDFTLNMREGDE